MNVHGVYIFNPVYIQKQKKTKTKNAYLNVFKKKTNSNKKEKQKSQFQNVGKTHENSRTRIWVKENEVIYIYIFWRVIKWFAKTTKRAHTYVVLVHGIYMYACIYIKLLKSNKLMKIRSKKK